MSWTQADIDALEQAIKKGVTRVTYQSGTVEYRSLSEMLRLRSIMKDEVSPSTSSDNVIYTARVR